MGVHAKHSRFTNQISDYLNNLVVSKFTNVQARKVLKQLDKHLFQKIKANPNVKLNDLDLDFKSFTPKL